jgi:hypothetical protein
VHPKVFVVVLGCVIVSEQLVIAAAKSVPVAVSAGVVPAGITVGAMAVTVG